MPDNEFGLISIITAAYNAKKTIKQAVNSALTQTYINIEILVINDCSTDNTAQIIKKIAEMDCRVKLIENQTNMGVSYTRKRGLEEARGEWVAILDSDDAWTPDKLEKQIELQKRTNAELLFTGSAFMDENGERINWCLHVPKELRYKNLLMQNLISNSSVLVKKELFTQFYAIGDNMHEDFAIWLGIAKSGRIAYGIDQPLLIYRIAQYSKSGNKLKSAIMNWNTYRYVGLGIIESAYYMFWYMINGLKKYKYLHKAKGE